MSKLTVRGVYTSDVTEFNWDIKSKLGFTVSSKERCKQNVKVKFQKISWKVWCHGHAFNLSKQDCLCPMIICFFFFFLRDRSLRQLTEP